MGKSGRGHRNYWYLLFKWSEYIFSSIAVGFSDKDSSSIHGILQAKILEWEATPSPGDIPDPGNQAQVSCIAGRFFVIWATREAPETAP